MIHDSFFCLLASSVGVVLFLLPLVPLLASLAEDAELGTQAVGAPVAVLDPEIFNPDDTGVVGHHKLALDLPGLPVPQAPQGDATLQEEGRVAARKQQGLQRRRRPA